MSNWLIIILILISIAIMLKAIMVAINYPEFHGGDKDLDLIDMNAKAIAVISIDLATKLFGIDALQAHKIKRDSNNNVVHFYATILSMYHPSLETTQSQWGTGNLGRGKTILNDMMKVAGLNNAITKDQQCLDFGAGDLSVAQAAAVHFKHVYAIDLALPKAPKNITCMLTSEAYENKSLHGKIDVILCSQVLHHVPSNDLMATLGHLRQWMTPKSYLCIREHDASNQAIIDIIMTEHAMYDLKLLISQNDPRFANPLSAVGQANIKDFLANYAKENPTGYRSAAAWDKVFASAGFKKINARQPRGYNMVYSAAYCIN
jgi:2-polyprenyl-3-methyl-5-hydroxy-6-metoxy-1,4-benzoquinol methylase